MAKKQNDSVEHERYQETYAKARGYAGLCPLYAFSHVPGVVILSDFSYGAAWVLEPIATSASLGQDKAFIANQLSGMIARLPDGARLQVMALPTRNVEDDIERYTEFVGGKNPILAELARARERFLREGVNGLGIMNGDQEFSVKSIKILVTLVVPYQKVYGGAVRAAKDAINQKLTYIPEDNDLDVELATIPGLARWNQIKDAYLAQFKTHMATVESTLHGIKPTVHFHRAEPDEFIRLYQGMTQLATGLNSKDVYDRSRPLPEQVMRREVRFQPNGLVLCDGFYHGVLTVDGMPHEIHAGILSEAHPNLGGNSLLDYIIDGNVCIGIRNPSRETVETWNTAFLKLATNGDGDPVEREQIIEDCKIIRAATKTEGRRVVEAQIIISMADKQDYLVQRRLELVMAKLREIGFRCRIEESAAPMFWAQQLPFGFYPTFGGSMRVLRRIDIAIACLLPIYLLGHGTRSKRTFFLNRAGEPVGFDVFESAGSFNFAVIAGSGGGKSVALTSIISDYTRDGQMKMFILDKGGSYAPLVSVVGTPTYKENPLTRTEKTGINAFDGTFEVAASGLMAWLPYLAYGAHEQMDGLLSGKIMQALKLTYDRLMQKDIAYTSLDDLMKHYGDCHFPRLGKRLKIENIDEEMVKNLISLRQMTADSGLEAKFQIFYQIRILGSTDTKRQSDRLQRVAQLTETERRRLRMDFSYLEEDETSIFVLSTNQDSGKKLAFDGYECSLEKRFMFLEAAGEREWELVTGSGVRPVFDEAYERQMRAVLAEQLEKRLGEGYDGRQIANMINEEMRTIDTMPYFKSIVGRADVQSTVLFRDFAKTLAQSTDTQLKELHVRLAPYYGDGAYSGFFDAPTGFDLDAHDVHVWDFEDIFKGDIKLVGALHGALLQMITAYCTHPKAANYKKIVFTDEYRKFQECPMADTYTDQCQRQGRKFHFATGVGTQRISDVKALMGEFRFKLVGVQPDDEIDATRDMLGFSVVQRAKLRNLRNSKGEYSSWILSNADAGIFEEVRLYLNPIAYWVATTDPPDKSLRTRKKNALALKGYSPRDAMTKAIQECAAEFPRGVAHAKKRKIL